MGGEIVLRFVIRLRYCVRVVVGYGSSQYSRMRLSLRSSVNRDEKLCEDDIGAPIVSVVCCTNRSLQLVHFFLGV